jgi:hypothetical protein
MLRVLNEVKTLDNTEGAIKIYIPEKLETSTFVYDWYHLQK